MPGRIMTAAKAKTEYGFKSIKRHGDKISIKNSYGKKVTVSAGQNVYHRGHGNFGIYSSDRVARRYADGTPRGKTERVGTGAYRHTGIGGHDKGKSRK